MRGRDGVDIEIVGATGGVNGGAFLYTNLDTIALGVVLSMTGLARSTTRPEQIIEQLKTHHAIAPLVEGGEVVEYSAHVIPEAGVAMMPRMTGDGLLVAGDAAALCLAAGIWLEGVNFAMASGMYAGEAAVEALAAGDMSAAGLAGYERRLAATFVLQDHRQPAPSAPARAVGPGAAPLSAAPGDTRRGDVPRRQPTAQAGAAPHDHRRAQAARHPSPRPGRRRARRRGGRSDEALAVASVHTASGTEGRAPSLSTPRSAQPFEELIGSTEFRRPPRRPHRRRRDRSAATAAPGECVVACPANLFVPTADGGILFNYEQCFECGTCYLVCNEEGAISWSYPIGGYGVVFHRS